MHYAWILAFYANIYSGSAQLCTFPCIFWLMIAFFENIHCAKYKYLVQKYLNFHAKTQRGEVIYFHKKLSIKLSFLMNVFLKSSFWNAKVACVANAKQFGFILGLAAGEASEIFGHGQISLKMEEGNPHRGFQVRPHQEEMKRETRATSTTATDRRCISELSIAPINCNSLWPPSIKRHTVLDFWTFIRKPILQE